MTLILSGTDSSVSAPAVQGGTAGTTTGVYYPATNQLALATNGTQALLVDSSQNVGIGTASPSGKLHVAGGASNANFYLSNNSYSSYYYQNTGGSSGVSFPASQAYLWDSGGTERMRITSGGYLKASNNGTYNNVSGSNHEFYNSANAETLIVRNANASFSSEALIVSADRNTTNNSYYFLRLNVPGVANRLLIADSGSISTAGSVQLGDAGAPPTSGVGVKFPATQSASSDANTLDDYEEGTWTPIFVSSGASFTYGNQGGYYTKVGRLVTATFNLMTNSVSGTTTSSLFVGGLPFTSANNLESSATAPLNDASRWNTNPPVVGQIGGNSTQIALYYSYANTTAGGDPSPTKASDMRTGGGNNNITRGTVTYFATS